MTKVLCLISCICVLLEITAQNKIDSTVVIRNCRIHDNQSASHGAGLYIIEGTYVTNTSIQNNIAKSGSAGGLAMDPGGIISNCLLTNNSARNYGGGIWARGDGARIYSTTIANNSLTNSIGIGSGIFMEKTAGNLMVNSIVTGNSKKNDFSYMAQVGNNFTIKYCSMEGDFYPNDHNVEITNGTASVFIAPTSLIGYNEQDTSWMHADWNLKSGSVAINSGSNEYVITDLDMNQNTRIQNGCVDMGAFESNFTTNVTSIAQKPQVWVHPSPCHDYIHVHLTDKSTKKLELFNLNGCLITTQDITELQNTIIINYLSQGVYILKIHDAHSTQTIKIIKQ